MSDSLSERELRNPIINGTGEAITVYDQDQV